MRPLVVLACIAVLSGCVSVEPDATRGATPRRVVGAGSSGVALEDTIEIFDGDLITIEFLDTGWGRLDIIAQHDLTVNLTLMNSAFNISGKNPTISEASSKYDVGNHTFILFTHPDEPYVYGSGFAAMWFGWPRFGPLANGASFPLSLTSGDRAMLLVDTSVAGFAVELLAGVVTNSRHFELALGENPASAYILPPVTSTSARHDDGTLRVEKVRTWSTGLLNLHASTVMAIGWTLRSEGSTATGVADDYMAAVRQGADQPAEPPSPRPQEPGDGGTTILYGANVDLAEPATYEFLRQRTETTAGNDSQVVGMAVMILPYHWSSIPVVPTTTTTP